MTRTGPPPAVSAATHAQSQVPAVSAYDEALAEGHQAATVEGPRHAWIDAGAGVAGDMLLGALIDLGVPLVTVQQAIDAVLPAAVRLSERFVDRSGLRSRKLDVEVLQADQPHRTWSGIRDMLDAADLSDRIRDMATQTFAAIAEAEGRVHGMPAEEVHFHEVGAADSIADVVGVCAGLVELDVATVSASAVAVGSGRTTIAHGDIPVPVPAVLELSRGWEILSGGGGELATPTGMALIRALATRCETLPAMRVMDVGVGAGSREVAGRPNVTRVVLGHLTGARPTARSMVVLEANVDDMDPQLWPSVLADLLSVGAADAWLTPNLMKKGRPAHTVSVLANPGDVGRLRAALFTSTSTLGIREYQLQRHELDRECHRVELAGGSVRIKVSRAASGEIVHATPEFDDVARQAATRGAAVREVLAEANAAAQHLLAGR